MVRGRISQHHADTVISLVNQQMRHNEDRCRDTSGRSLRSMFSSTTRRTWTSGGAICSSGPSSDSSTRWTCVRFPNLSLPPVVVRHRVASRMSCDSRNVHDQRNSCVPHQHGTGKHNQLFPAEIPRPDKDFLASDDAVDQQSPSPATSPQNQNVSNPARIKVRDSVARQNFCHVSALRPPPSLCTSMHRFPRLTLNRCASLINPFDNAVSSTTIRI